ADIQPRYLRNPGKDPDVRWQRFPGRLGDLSRLQREDRDRDDQTRNGVADRGRADRDDFGRNQVSERDGADDLGNRGVVPGDTKGDVGGEWNGELAARIGRTADLFR